MSKRGWASGSEPFPKKPKLASRDTLEDDGEDYFAASVRVTEKNGSGIWE